MFSTTGFGCECTRNRCALALLARFSRSLHSLSSMNVVQWCTILSDMRPIASVTGNHTGLDDLLYYSKPSCPPPLSHQRHRDTIATHAFMPGHLVMARKISQDGTHISVYGQVRRSHANTLIFKSTTANHSSINQEVIHCHTNATSSPKPQMHVCRGTWS